MTDLTVGIYRNYDFPDLTRQTPKSKCIWKNVRFLIDHITEPCDIDELPASVFIRGQK